ncbi:DUF1570 domain-containing protein [Lignipirellula cremea]|nr:DUF1570 domain-containing protein [Lignipirellula cremea]
MSTLLLLLLASSAGLRAEDPQPEPGSRIEQTAHWEMETLKCKDGRTLYGLMQKITRREMEFVEVVRRSGKPLYLVVHYYAPGAVEKWTKLDPPDRRELIQRIGPLLLHKNRRRIEAGRMEVVELRESTVEGVVWRQASTPSFLLKSTADEDTTRRAVVRLEQMFRAYQQILPPQLDRNKPVTIELLGTRAEYRAELARRQLQIENPAFFSAAENLIVAGDDLQVYAEQLVNTRAENEQVRRRYDALDADFEERITKLAADLKANGYQPTDIQAEIRLRRAAWTNERTAAMTRILEANRRNETRSGQLLQRVFARLFHESFHAWYENYVFPERNADTPRWLHEGLAQIFETGHLEADTLRIDAPSRESLLALQEDLRGPEPLRLRELLTSEENAFLAWRHDPNISERYYLYSWGVAWYLTFDRDLLSADSLSGYVSPQAAREDPIPRFERFVGQDLETFEAAWQKAMLDRKPSRP